jgi:ABC-type iron transport system FetAB permease component
VSEGQRFMTKVMGNRPAAAPPQPQEAAEPSVLGEMKPYLALGAGPAEAIPVAQRQAVRQSVTPH